VSISGLGIKPKRISERRSHKAYFFSGLKSKPKHQISRRDGRLAAGRAEWHGLLKRRISRHDGPSRGARSATLGRGGGTRRRRSRRAWRGVGSPLKIVAVELDARREATRWLDLNPTTTNM
jgi:hypothetical protein